MKDIVITLATFILTYVLAVTIEVLAHQQTLDQGYVINGGNVYSCKLWEVPKGDY